MFAKSNRSQNRLSLAIWLMLAATLNVSSSGFALAQEDDDRPQRTGRLLKVDLPLTSSVVSRLTQQIRELSAQLPVAVANDDRSVLVLEFETKNENSGQGSDLGACISLADLLTGPDLKRLRTVAWIPADDSPTSLVGHAVLVAVSCNELAMAKQSSIGKANIDMETVPQRCQRRSIKGSLRNV